MSAAHRVVDILSVRVDNRRYPLACRGVVDVDPVATASVSPGPVDEQAMLIENDPALYYKPAYLGPSGWVALRVGGPDTDWERVADRVAQSWELAAPRRLLEMGGR